MPVGRLRKIQSKRKGVDLTKIPDRAGVLVHVSDATATVMIGELAQMLHRIAQGVEDPREAARIGLDKWGLPVPVVPAVNEEARAPDQSERKSFDPVFAIRDALFRLSTNAGIECSVCQLAEGQAGVMFDLSDRDGAVRALRAAADAIGPKDDG